MNYIIPKKNQNNSVFAENGLFMQKTAKNPFRQFLLQNRKELAKTYMYKNCA